MFHLPSSLNIPQISRLEVNCFLGLGCLRIILCFPESFSFLVKYTSYVKPFVNSVVNLHVPLLPPSHQPADFESVLHLLHRALQDGHLCTCLPSTRSGRSLRAGSGPGLSSYLLCLVHGVCSVITYELDELESSSELGFYRKRCREGGRDPPDLHLCVTRGSGRSRLSPSLRVRPTGLPSQPFEKDAPEGLTGDWGRSHAAGSSCGWTKSWLAKSTVLIHIMTTIQVIFLSRKTERSPVSSPRGSLFSQGGPAQ